MNAIPDKPASAPVAAQTPAAPPARRGGRAVKRLALLGAVALVAGASGVWWFTEGRWIESTDNAYVQGDMAVLGARIEGDIVAIPVADNQPVHAGDPLLQLDPADWQVKLEQARDAAAEAGAAIVTAQRQVEQSAAMIAQADAQIAQAQAELTRATADAGRAGALVSSGWTSRQANDQAVADQRKATALLTSAHAQRDSAARAIAVAQAQVSQSEARKATLDAAVKLAERNLGYTVVRAPFDGIVANRAAQLGQHVNPALQLIAVAPARERLWVIANFKETQLRRMRAGQKATLIPDIDSSAAVEGHIDSLAPATGALFSLLPPENATGNFTKVVQRVPVKIVLDPEMAARATWLRAGLSVTAEVDSRGETAVRHGFLGSIAHALGLG